MAQPTAIWFATLALLGAGAPAFAQLRADVYTRDAAGDAVSDQVTAPGAALVARTVTDAVGGTRTSTLQGLAAADTQTLRAMATLQVDAGAAGSYGSAKTTASFSKVLFLDPVLLGLPTGMAYSLLVPLHFDGLGKTGSDTAGGSSFSYTSTDVSLTYRVSNLDRLVAGEGPPRPERVMQFGYGLRMVYDSRYDATVSSAGWSGWSNATALVDGGAADRYDPVVPTRGSVSEAVDTGPLLFYINAAVGDHLKIDASLDVFLQAEAHAGTGFSQGLFQNTFDAGLLGTTPGATFLGETPGVFTAAVPEPATTALWLGGLAALGLGCRRRRTAA